MRTIITILEWTFAVSAGVVGFVLLIWTMAVIGLIIAGVALSIGNSIVWVLEATLEMSRSSWAMAAAAAFWVCLPIAAMVGGILYIHEDTPEE